MPAKAVAAMISEGAYEQLRRILEKQYKRTFTSEEVKEIGDELLDFYILLVNIKDRLKTNR